VSPDLPPIFIAGVARSGTTILGKFFENNSQCKYFFEDDIWRNDFNSFYYRSYTRIIRNSKFLANPTLRSYHQKLFTFLRKILSKPDLGHRLTESDVTPEMFDNVKKILAEIDKKRIVIKNPRNSLRIPFIKKLFPDAKFLHIVRDGRDATCSLIIKKDSDYWFHVKPPEWQKIQKKYPKGPLKYAWQWNETINFIRQDMALLNPEDFVEIKYEDLVASSKKVMKEVFEKFGIPFEKPQEDLCEKVTDKVIRENLPTVSSKWTKDHPKRIKRYQEDLSKDEIMRVEEILGKNNKLYGYQ